MKRTIPLFALSSSFALVLSSHAVWASTLPSKSLSTSSKAIYLNGKLVSKPSGFVKNGTTYVPIWYVGYALSQAGISNTWKNGVMNFTVPSLTGQKLTAGASTSGTVKMAINGQAVEACDGIAAIDPASNQPTEYLPIWYVMQALNQMQVQSKWDGTNWRLATTNTSLNTGSGSSAGSSSGSGSKSGGTSSTGSASTGGQSSASGTGTSGKTSAGSGSSASSNPAGSGSSTGSSSASGSTSPSGSTSTSSSTSSNQSGSTSGAGSSGTSSTVSVSDLIDSILGTTSYTQLPQLTVGSSGPYVSVVQSFLKQLGYPATQSGQFDAVTQINLEQFQNANGLTSNGVVDSETWKALQQAVLLMDAPPAQTSTSSSSTSSTSSSSSSSSTSPIPSQPTGNGFTNVDLRYPAPANINTNSINSYLQQHGAPLTGLGQTFMNAQQLYGIDANYLVSHAVLESYWGKSQIAQSKNNLFGYGAYDSAPGQDAGLFPSEEYAILFEGWVVHNSYLTPGGSEYVSPTLVGMNVHYATDQQWANSIGSLMGQLASSVNDTVASYPQYNPGNQPPAPTSTQEPVYYTNATATVQSVPNYPGLPYYSSPGTGDQEMYVGTLQQGDSGANVAAVQAFLDQTMNAGLTQDGQYGPLTKQAVIAFQAAHNLPQTGQWTYTMWQMFMPMPATIPSGQTVTISKIEMGMANGLVAEWDYVNGYGWVDSQYLTMQNVYRAISLQPESINTTIQVYGQDKQTVIQIIHSGDFVVATTATPQNGFFPVEVCDQTTGQVEQGYISAAEANLVQLQ